MLPRHSSALGIPFGALGALLVACSGSPTVTGTNPPAPMPAPSTAPTSAPAGMVTPSPSTPMPPVSSRPDPNACPPGQVRDGDDCLKAFEPKTFDDWLGTYSDIGEIAQPDGTKIKGQIYVTITDEKLFGGMQSAEVFVGATTRTTTLSAGIGMLTTDDTGNLYESCDATNTGKLMPHAVGTWSPQKISIPFIIDIGCRPLMPMGHLDGVELTPKPGPRIQVVAHDYTGATITGTVTRVLGT
jgi:hypothetical protein